jgi:streptogramin lyase
MTLLDANTLQVIRTAVAPGRPDPSIFTVPVIASHGNLLWLSNGHVLYKLDPSTASVLISKNYSGIPSSLSIDPDGRWLYMGVEVASAPNATNRLIQVDATSGTQTASVAAGTPDLGGPSVSAASDGVWVTYATGMMGTVEHRSSNLLHLISSQAGAGSNGVKIFVTGSIVWIENGAGDSLGCIDPRSGSLRAGMSIDQLPAAGPVSGDTRGSWVAQGQRVDLLNPPASCYS